MIIRGNIPFLATGTFAFNVTCQLLRALVCRVRILSVFLNRLPLWVLHFLKFQQYRLQVAD